MNMSDNQVKRKRLLCVIQSTSSLTKATESKAFRMSQSRKKTFSSLYEIAPQKKQAKSHQKQADSMSAYFWTETIVSVKHATRTPSPCHPSAGKSIVNATLQHTHIHIYTCKHTTCAKMFKHI